VIIEAPQAAPWRGYLLMSMVALSWGFHWPLTKFALDEIPPVIYRTAGLLFAGVVLLAIAHLREGLRGIPRGERLAITISAILNITCFNATVAYGLYLMDAGQAIIVAYTYPVWMVVLARVLLGERVTLPRAAALTLGVAAVVILFLPSEGNFHLPLLGTAIMLFNALSWAGGNLYYKTRRWSVPTMELVGWQMLIGAVPMVAAAAVLERLPDISAVSTNALMALVYSMIVAQALAHWAWFRALDYLSAVVASLITLVNPVIGVLASAWLLGEPLTSQKLIALACAVAALFILVTAGSPRWSRIGFARRTAASSADPGA
jgi:drug/metabolite transporter (DMT)-like permease